MILGTLEAFNNLTSSPSSSKAFMFIRCADSLIDRALTHQKSGQVKKAGLIYRGLLRRQYQSARLLTNYGVVQYQLGNQEDGIRHFEAALQLDPSYQNAWHNLVVDSELTNGDYLIRISAEILSLFPGLKLASFAQAHGYIANGNYSQAKKALTPLFEDAPDDLFLCTLLARCDLALGDVDSAVVHVLYILSRDPGNPFAAIEMSDIAAKAGDFDSSISILERAHQCNPDDGLLILKTARTYQSSGAMQKALEMFELALAKFPDSPEVMGGMAYCCAETGSISKFSELCDRIIANPQLSPEALSPLIFVCSTLGEDFLDRLRELTKLYWSLQGGLICHPNSKVKCQQTGTEKPVVNLPVESSTRRRVGIVTGDLGVHVVSSFLASFLLNYSKDLIEVEVVSNQWRNDQVAEVLSSAVDNCFSIADYGVSAARSFLRSREYDVIIETSGFTYGTAIHILAERCAPAQCHWIGYHASTFMPTMDYFVGDPVLIPAAHSSHFSERIIRLDRAWLAATPFTQIPEAIGKSSSDDVVIGSFSQMAKLTEATLSSWAKVLIAAPHVKLLLKDRLTNDEIMKTRIVDYFMANGIPSDRIMFMGRSDDWFEHMTIYNTLDLALDTTPWSSATTAFDALSMGVPLIGLRGKTTSGLMSASVLSHCGKGHWIAESEYEYVEKCLAIIEEIQSHRQCKRELQAEILQSQLFDGRAMAQAIEKFVFHV